MARGNVFAPLIDVDATERQLRLIRAAAELYGPARDRALAHSRRLEAALRRAGGLIVGEVGEAN